MKGSFFGLAISLASATSAIAADGPHLVTALSPTRSNGIVQVTIANDGDANAYVFVNQFPQVGDDGLTTNNRFTVIGAMGRQASYIGANYDYLVTVDGYRSIGPGQKLTFDVNIPRNYRVSPGAVKIVLETIAYEREPMATDQKDVLFTKATDPIEVWLQRDAIPAGTP